MLRLIEFEVEGEVTELEQAIDLPPLDCAHGLGKVQTREAVVRCLEPLPRASRIRPCLVAATTRAWEAAPRTARTALGQPPVRSPVASGASSSPWTITRCQASPRLGFDPLSGPSVHLRPIPKWADGVIVHRVREVGLSDDLVSPLLGHSEVPTDIGCPPQGWSRHARSTTHSRPRHER
jgi:hypothetical protein